MFTDTVCQEVVGILTALIFGADGACVDMGLRSVLPALLALGAGILVLQLAVRAVIWGVLRALFHRPARARDGDALAQADAARPRHAPPEPSRGRVGKTDPDGGPVKTRRRWR